MIQQMGYNPFRPHMSFSSGATATATTAPASLANTGADASAGPASPYPPVDLTAAINSLGREAAAAAEEATMAEVDDAFAMLLSLGMFFYL